MISLMSDMNRDLNAANKQVGQNLPNFNLQELINIQS
jgi:hypothetical protein